MSKADYYSKHLFISALLHTVAMPNASVSSASGSLFQPGEAPTLIPGSTKPFTAAPGRMDDSHPTGELPQPAIASRGNGARRNWLRARSSSRSRDSKVKKYDPHLQKDEGPPSDDTNDDGVNWIFESIEGPGAKDGAERGTDGTVEPEDGIENEMLTQAHRQAAHIAFVNELKGEGRVLLDVTNLYIFLLRDGKFLHDSHFIVSWSFVHIASDPLGTVVTIYKKAADGLFAAPILRRLRSMHTLLRRSNDPSLLLQAILDFGG